MSEKVVLITGGAGFIGSHLADAFHGEGFRVHVIDDLSGGQPSNLPPEVELHQLDIRSPEAAHVVETCGAQLLVHHAAQMDVRRSVDDPAFDADINVVGSLRLFEAARRGSVSQVIFASTGGAIYGEQEHFPADEEHPTRPLSPYGVSKMAVERYLYFYQQTYGLNVACLRYANVYGERQNPHGEAGVVAIFLNRLLERQQAVINGDGLQTRDYVHVSDVVRANLAMVGRAGFQLYNVGTAKETTVIELFSGLCEALGLDIEAPHGPAKSGEQRRSVVDPSRLLTDFGLPEPLSLSKGLGRTAKWFRKRHQATKAG
jgi:UDP-glucose 4-epimerase